MMGRAHRRIEHRADRINVCAEQKELADLPHDFLVIHVDFARRADDFGDVLRVLYRG